MKTPRSLYVLTLSCAALLSFSYPDHSLTLQQAIDDKQVSATVLPFGNSGYSDGLRINVKNISGKTLQLKLPKGSIFIPDNSGEQTLVTSGDELFALSPGQEKQIVRPGFCTELHDHGSDDTSTFQLACSKNEKLLNLLAYMDSLQVTDKDFIQQAVWCITDDQDIAYANCDDTLQTRLVQQKLCALTRKEMPWYDTKAEIIQTPQHEFVIQPIEITGEIVINSDVPVTLQGMVKDSTGKILYTNPNPSYSPEGETTLDYTLHVEGWAKGKYYVVYTSNGKEVLNREFEI